MTINIKIKGLDVEISINIGNILTVAWLFFG